MLKRIQEIKCVGCFRDAVPSRVQFEQLTFIYGENCYGKSTLCDIFLSLSENSPSYIVDRKSLPNPSNLNQRIQLSFLMPGQESECPLTFTKASWSRLLEPNLKIIIFDTSFIHRNVFTGLTIERTNQENITQFILGEDSVKTANDIAELNSELRSVTRNIRQIEETAFQGIADIGAFLTLDVLESPEQLQQLIGSLNDKLKAKKDLAQNLEGAKTRDELSCIDITEDVQVFIDKVDACLQSTFEQVHDQAVKMLNEHINQKTRALGTTKNWLYQGLDQYIKDYCPFCGQELQVEAQALLNTYRSYFNKEFNKFLDHTKTILEQLLCQLRYFQMSEVSISILKNTVVLTIYPELTADHEFQKKLTLLTEAGSSLDQELRDWQTKYSQFERLLVGKIRIKEQRPYAFVETCSSSAAIYGYNQLKATAISYNSLVTDINQIFKSFKEGLDQTKIVQEIVGLEHERDQLSLRMRRKQAIQACAEYEKNVKKKKELYIKIPELQKQLENSQTQFLDEYFTSINQIFKKLGSKEFHISKQVSRRGNMPVVQLVANYSGVKIGSGKLKAFFGESDRRALALSIFWSKIISHNHKENERTIIVMDDPVTSFDEGRIGRTIRLINDSLSDFRQVIIFSHYPNYLKTFCERVRDQGLGIQLYIAS